ncbi:MAG: hypothetical protein JWM19_6869, partial [Actinomycetia bacterium]|nr:hypothetical protein [Actinomycetes bacterium]
MCAQRTGVIRIGRRTARRFWRAVVTGAALVVALCMLAGPAAAQPAAHRAVSAPAAKAANTAHTVSYDG